MKFFKKAVLSMMILGMMTFVSAPQGYAAWPDAPITVVIQYAAGGGTDMLTRLYAKLMEKPLGATINAVNREGAIGAMAMDFVNSKPSDGYWWMGASQYSKPLRVMGHTKLNPWKDWQYYNCATGIQAWAVKPDSPFKTFADFLDAARKNPGKFSLSHSGVGGIWHEGNELLMSATKINFRQIPYKGGAPATLAALQGEVDVAGSGLHEQIEFIRAGKLRSLAVFTNEPIRLKDGTVLRPVTNFVPGLGKFAPFGSEYTLGIKRETPADILEKVKQAFIVAVNSPEFEDFLEKRFFFKDLKLGEDADKMAALRESVTAWLFWNSKIEGAKINPADIGIPKPEEFDAWWPSKDYKPRIRSK
ncbi:MAG: tripartite tricarboxylate transporter substrate binding protein [Thermodesulfobacteriota bacterium]|nr:tripartite tricarboxylate transporter substrate binding protein [Thermodesulfobacteriota bacterium]